MRPLLLPALVAGLLALAIAAGLDRWAAPAPAVQPTAVLSVFAASSLSDAFGQIGRDFEQANPGTRVSFNFAGSQQLAAQLGQGAPADLFASASAQQMQVAVESGRVAPDAPRIFALNRLVVVTAPAGQGSVARLQDLAGPGLRLIFAAQAVPVGQYSLDFLDRAAADPAFGAGFKDRVLKNVVSYEDNVRAVLTKVALGEGDAGIVYASDLVASPGAPVGSIEIPAALNVSAGYPVALVRDSPRAALAQKFVDYLLARDARRILASYGFALP